MSEKATKSLGLLGELQHLAPILVAQEKTLREDWRLFGKSRCLRMAVFYAKNDRLTNGQKGATWFDQCWREQVRQGLIDYRSEMIDGRNHESLIDPDLYRGADRKGLHDGRQTVQIVRAKAGPRDIKYLILETTDRFFLISSQISIDLAQKLRRAYFHRLLGLVAIKPPVFDSERPNEKSSSSEIFICTAQRNAFSARPTAFKSQ